MAMNCYTYQDVHIFCKNETFQNKDYLVCTFFKGQLISEYLFLSLNRKSWKGLENKMITNLQSYFASF